ncbi:MAG TPA: 1,6-anhydro-N-acetylmuramyl-L-alanine amidase AmpD [Methylomicrobium sp.]|nr:1,6-anhydro-N-acetylmuramyl-L-alanine amidase AmpD [Methylomicrobium sp.]
MQIEDHWLRGVKRIESPNFDDRPDADDISLIVIHCISLPPGEFDHPLIEHLFCNHLDPGLHPYFAGIYQLKVSAHLLINRNGEITQFVSFGKRAWHAGVSSYQGRERCNDFSIGIELEGVETVPYTLAQYQQLAKVIKTLLANYPMLSRERITGHSDIAPDRKTDPGASFDWKKLGRMLE